MIAAPSGWSSLTPYLVVVGAMVGLVLLIGVLAWRRNTGQPSPRSDRRERDAAVREQRALRGDMEDLMRDLDAMSKRIHAQLDERLARLERAITAADERIVALRDPGGPQRTDAVSPARANGSTPQANPERALGQQGDARHALILQLAAEGRSPVEIAQKTGRTTGEVELILSLRNA